MMNTDYLQGWNVVEEQRKADFMEHLYNCSGRKAGPPGVVGLYTGLWQDFCIREAGAFVRERYFEMVEAIKIYEAQQKETANIS